MEALHVYPGTKLRYKLQDHVLGIEIGRDDFGVIIISFVKDLNPHVRVSLFNLTATSYLNTKRHKRILLGLIYLLFFL